MTCSQLAAYVLQCGGEIYFSSFCSAREARGWLQLHWKSCQSIGRVADTRQCHVEVLDPLWVEGRGCPFWHLWEHRVFLLSLGWVICQGKGCGCLYSAAVWIVAQPGPLQAFTGFSVNLDRHETKVLV